MATRYSKIKSRSLKFEPRPFGGWLALTLTHEDGTKATTTYSVDEIPSDAGRSFTLTRVEGEDEMRSYTVHLGPSGMNACGCKANAHKGCCKHTEALQVCVQRGLIGNVGIPASGETEDAQNCVGA